MRAAVLLARRVLAASGARTLILIVVLSVSLGFSLFAATGARRTSSVLDRFIAWSEPGDVNTGGAAGDVPVAEFLDEVAALPSVLESQRIKTINTYGVRLEGGDDLPPFEMGAAAFEEGGLTFDRAFTLRGEMPADPPADAGVIDFLTAERYDLDVGSTLTLVSPTAPEASTTVETTVRIVGVFSSPTSMPTIAGFHFAGVLLGPAFLDEHPELVDPYAETMSIRLRPGSTVDDLRAEMTEAGLDHIDVIPILETVRAGAERLFTLEATTMWAAALLALVVGLPIAYQVTRRDVFANRNTIDTVLALGASRRQLLQAATLRGAVIGTIAATIATAGAIAASPASPVGMARNAEFDRGVWVDGTVLLVAVPAFIVALSALTGLATWSATRPVPAPSGGTRSLRPPSRGVRSTVGFGMATGPQTTGAAAGIGALVLVATIVVGMVVTAASLAALPDDAHLAGGVWDVFLDVQPQAVDALDQRLDELPYVEAHGTGGWVELDAEGEYLYALSLPRVDGMDPAMVRGRAPNTESEVALGAAAMDRLGVRIGDEVDVTLLGEDGPSRALTVTGEMISAPPLFQMHEPDDAALVAFPATTGDEHSGDTQLVRFGRGVDPERMLQEMQDDLPRESLFFAFARARRGDVVALERLQNLVRSLLAMAGVLAAASLVHHLLVTTRRSTHDLAVVRAFGGTSADVTAAGAWSGAIVAVVIAVLAIPLGVAAGSLAWRYLAGELIVLPETTVPRPLLAVGTAVVLGIALAVAAGLARRRARRPVAASLRAE